MCHVRMCQVCMCNVCMCHVCMCEVCTCRHAFTRVCAMCVHIDPHTGVGATSECMSRHTRVYHDVYHDVCIVMPSASIDRSPRIYREEDSEEDIEKLFQEDSDIDRSPRGYRKEDRREDIETLELEGLSRRCQEEIERMSRSLCNLEPRKKALKARGGGLGSRPIFKKFHETYAPS